MKNWRLYVILDKALAGDKDLKKLAEEVIKGGADAIQLRDKISSSRAFTSGARVVRDITKYFGIQFIVNDRVDIAASVDADGVHLGQEDLPAADARLILGRSKLVGISCHSVEQAIEAEREGADYIGWGPVFRTSTKPGLEVAGMSLVSEIKKCLKIPVIYIGGINAGNIKGLLEAGADAVAVASAVITSDNPRLAAREIKNILERKEDDPVRICKE